MFDWIKKMGANYPEFWKVYLSKFDKKSKRYVAISVETTGSDINEDVIISVSAIGIVDEKIDLNDFFEVTIPQYKYLHAKKITSNFFLENGQPKMTEPDAVEKLISFIGNAVIVGFRVNLELDFINTSLAKLNCGKLKNDALDIEIMHKKFHDINDKDFTIYDLSKLYKIPINDRLSTSDDVFTIALLFLKLKQRLNF